MDRSIKHWDYIDALRGLAALGVIVVHIGTLFTQTPWRASQFFNLGAHGVQLFFMVSAVTLASSWHSRAAKEADPVRAFFIRRFFRIAPLFWIATLVYLLVALAMMPFWRSGPVEAQSVFLTLIFAHGWTPASINGVVPGGWSIADEMTFYLMFPLLMVLVTNLRRAVALFAISVLVALTANQYGATIYNVPLKSPFLYYWLPNQIPVFALGLVAYHLIPWARSTGEAASWKLMAAGAVLLALTAWGPFPWTASLSHPMMWRDMVAAFGFLVIILALAAHPWKLLVNETTKQMGEVSFSTYLVQFVVIQVALSILGRTSISGWKAIVLYGIAIVVVATVTTMLATVTYRRIEKPFIRLGHRLATPEAKAPAAGIALELP